MRICKTLDNTETFKQKKQGLIGEGFDPRRVQDQIFFKDPASGAYRPIDPASHARILGRPDQALDFRTLDLAGAIMAHWGWPCTQPGLPYEIMS